MFHMFHIISVNPEILLLAQIDSTYAKFTHDRYTDNKNSFKV